MRQSFSLDFSPLTSSSSTSRDSIARNRGDERNLRNPKNYFAFVAICYSIKEERKKSLILTLHSDFSPRHQMPRSSLATKITKPLSSSVGLLRSLQAHSLLPSMTHSFATYNHSHQHALVHFPPRICACCQVDGLGEGENN